MRYFSIKYLDKTRCICGLDSRTALFFYLQGSDVDDEDVEELLNDTRLLKKLKKGQISEEDFEKRITSKPKAKQNTDGPSNDGSE